MRAAVHRLRQADAGGEARTIGERVQRLRVGRVDDQDVDLPPAGHVEQGLPGRAAVNAARDALATPGGETPGVDGRRRGVVDRDRNWQEPGRGLLPRRTSVGAPHHAWPAGRGSVGHQHCIDPARVEWVEHDLPRAVCRTPSGLRPGDAAVARGEDPAETADEHVQAVARVDGDG